MDLTLRRRCSRPGLATISIFFCFLYVKKSLICLEGKIMTPHWGKHFSLPFLPATPLSPSRTIEVLFELTRRPSRPLNSPRALLPELQRYEDTVRCAALDAKVPGHNEEQLTQTLIVCLLKTHFLHQSLIVKSQQNRIEFVTRPGGHQLSEAASLTWTRPRVQGGASWGWQNLLSIVSKLKGLRYTNHRQD